MFVNDFFKWSTIPFNLAPHPQIYEYIRSENLFGFLLISTTLKKQNHFLLMLFRPLFFSCLMAFSVVLFSSCRPNEKPVTKEEALKMAADIEASIKQKNGSVLNNAVDVNLLMSRMDLPDKEKLFGQSGFKNGLNEKMKLGTIVLQSMQDGGSYQMVKQYNKGDTQHLVFRFYSDGSINYHDLELGHVKGKCKIADIFIYLSGENFSETLGNIYKYLDNGNGVSAADTKAFKRITEIRKLMNAGDYTGAQAEMNKIPVHFKSMKPVKLIEIMVAAQVDDSAYTKALADYKNLYPNEPNIHLLEIDGYYMQGKYEKCIEAVDQLDRAINKDPLLDFQRSLIYKTMGKTDSQKECLLRLIKNMPEFEPGATEMVAYYLDNKEYKNADSAIADFNTHAAFDQAALKDIVSMYPAYKMK